MIRSAEPWWREAVGYQVYLRSFADSDGDGVGDLRGLRNRLGHLVELDVDALWVSPFYPSPQVDHGYDVADHRAVDPLFGDLSEVDALLADAHAAGLRLLIDVVPNHTSDQHPWFQSARISDDVAARGRYHVLPGLGGDGERPPNGWRSMFGGPVWTRLPDGAWYLHLFAPEQPDLNWTNPEVATDFDATLRFWLDRGVDGIRIDVAGGMCKDPDYVEVVPGSEVHPHWNRPELGALHRRWRALVDSYPGDRVSLGELWGPPERVARRVSRGGLHQVFQFDWAVVPWSAEALRHTAASALTELGAVGALPTWLLSSHDLPRPVTRYGAGPVGLARARAKALCTLALPGAVWIYQGEELGLGDVDLPDSALRDPTWERSGHTERGRDAVRVPLPWTVDGTARGFSPGDPWLPQPAWPGQSVAEQDGVPGSTLTLYRDALRLRRKLLVGTPHRWFPADPDVVAFRRGPIVCALNTAEVDRPPPMRGTPLLSSAPGGSGSVLPPNSATWLLAD